MQKKLTLCFGVATFKISGLLVASSGSIRNNHDVGYFQQNFLRYNPYQYQQTHYIMHFIIFSYMFRRHLQLQ
jgi:hypothetical protein